MYTLSLPHIPARIPTLCAAALSIALSTLSSAQQIPVAVVPAPGRHPTPGVLGPNDLPLKEPVATLAAKHNIVLPQNLPFVDLAPIDLAQVVAEDLASPSQLRDGVSRPMNFDLGMGQWFKTPDGGWLWALDVKAPGMYGVRLHMDQFALPDGAEMIVYDPQIPTNLPDPYRARGLIDTGEFWAWTSWSDTARVEVYFPHAVGNDRFANHFTIDQAIQMYRNPVTGAIGAYGNRELGCHNDLECSPSWTTFGRSVGLMQFVLNGNSGGCTGALLNSGNGDLTPYFMTAHHCMNDNGGALASLQVYWLYEENGCGGAVPSLGSVPRSSVASYVRSDLSVDMSLVMIEGTVPRNLWWLGNDEASFPEGTQIVGIHHPRGTRKRISFGNADGYSIHCDATGLTDGFNVNYYSGTVEPGSSGSPLMFTDGAFMGVCSCGPNPPNCPVFGQTGDVYGSWFVGSGSFTNFLYYGGSDDGNEPNDSCGSATNLNIYTNGTLYSQIVKVNNSDWFHINVPAFGTVSFHSHFTSANGDIDMALHDGCGAVLAGSVSTTDDENITWVNPTGVAKEVYLNVYLFNDTRNIYYLDFSRSAPNAPANNACSSASDLAFGAPGVPQIGSVSGTTFGATQDGSTNCATTGPDVWYRLSVPCTRTVNLDTYGSHFDTVLSVHTGCPGTTANQVVCNDDDPRGGGDTYSSLSFNANGGQYYYVRVSGYQGAFGTYFLNWYLPNASNDLCANSVDLAPGAYAFNNCTCDTDGPSEDVCLNAGSNQIYNDFWIGYTPPCYGTIELNTFGSGFDTKVAVYANPDNSTCPYGPNTAIACNDDTDISTESQVIFSCTPGQHYIFRIGSYAMNDGHPGLLHLIYTAASPCTPPTGACCTGGACSISAQADCLNQGGTYFGDDTTCDDPNLCTPPTTGACCIVGQCTLTTSADCNNQGGIYFGDGTTCDDPDLCNAPTGACCIAGVCNILPPIACINMGGNYFGDGTDCADPNLCGVTTGACCTGGVCEVLAEADCTNQGGIWGGPGTDCADPNICIPPPTGACCTINQCNVTTNADCDAAGGSWMGEGTQCLGPASCPPHCGSVDFNCDGDLGTDADLAAYFACLAGDCPALPCISNLDFNGDGDLGTDADIEAFFRVLGGGAC